MAWFRRNQRYDRSRLLRKAVGARKKGRRKKAIELYRKVLAVEPDDARVHRKVAPLLAATKQRDDAWQSYQRAAETLRGQGFVDQAIGVLRDAARYLADKPELWHALCRLELERHRPADAVSGLLEGAGHLRSRRNRDSALSLLLAARKIAPDAFKPNLALGRQLVRCGYRDRGVHLLEQLADRTVGVQRRAVRALLFRISPTPAAAWRWLRAA
jgi:tetratricopeptide (TPR) repeat protein